LKYGEGAAQILTQQYAEAIANDEFISLLTIAAVKFWGAEF
jgi:hypothetical protein